MMKTHALGRNAEIVQIIEFEGPTHDAQWMLPDATPQILQANASWLRNHFWMPRTNRLVFSYQLWLVKTSDAIVLIDTGCGNHKPRVSPYQNMINTPVIDWLEGVGAAPEKVTHVLHTHLHSDHVGWNTRLLDGRWEPTFPNATYYMPQLDYELFTQRLAQKMSPEMYDGVIADSVTPIVAAGLTKFIEPGDEVAGFIASAAPGHTPGQLVYSFRHNGGETIFAGDVFHSPIQVIHPHINSRWCEDQEQARLTRHALLCGAAARNAKILPAHIQGLDGWRVGRDGDGFSIGFDHPLDEGVEGTHIADRAHGG
jgi:glyoxylase-like metal-dependent hydrolase (beta-lactamase superfamily II)